MDAGKKVIWKKPLPPPPLGLTKLPPFGSRKSIFEVPGPSKTSVNRRGLGGDESSSSSDDEDGQALLSKVIKKYPEDFNHLAYLKYIKKNAITRAGEDIKVNKVIKPFYQSLSSAVGNRKNPIPSVPAYAFSEAELANDKMKLVNLILKVKALVVAVIHDRKLPENQHELFIRALSQNIMDILTITGINGEADSRKVILSAAHAISRLLIVKPNPDTPQDIHDEETPYPLSETGVDLMLTYLVDFITTNYTNAGILMFKCELVSDILLYLKPNLIRRRMLELLFAAVKSSLNRIHRASKNEKKHCFLPMEEVDILFRVLMMVESIVISLPFIKESELVSLQCIEKSVFGAMKLPLISLFVTRITTVATNAPRAIKKPNQATENFRRRNCYSRKQDDRFQNITPESRAKYEQEVKSYLQGNLTTKL